MTKELQDQDQQVFIERNRDEAVESTLHVPTANLLPPLSSDALITSGIDGKDLDDGRDVVTPTGDDVVEVCLSGLFENESCENINNEITSVEHKSNMLGKTVGEGVRCDDEGQLEGLSELVPECKTKAVLNLSSEADEQIRTIRNFDSMLAHLSMSKDQENDKEGIAHLQRLTGGINEEESDSSYDTSSEDSPCNENNDKVEQVETNVSSGINMINEESSSASGSTVARTHTSSVAHGEKENARTTAPFQQTTCRSPSPFFKRNEADSNSEEDVIHDTPQADTRILPYGPLPPDSSSPRQALTNNHSSTATLSTATHTAASMSQVRMPMCLPNFRPATGCTNASDFIVRCFVARLRSGITVVKHGRSRWCKSRLRILHIHSDGKCLSWKPAQGEPTTSKRPPRLDLTTCIEVRHAWTPDPLNPMFTGTPLLRQKCEAANAFKSFALIFARRTVDITAVTADQCKVLMEGFSALCFRLQVATSREIDTTVDGVSGEGNENESVEGKGKPSTSTSPSTSFGR